MDRDVPPEPICTCHARQSGRALCRIRWAFSFSQLERQANRAANALLSLGLKQHDCVALFHRTRRVLILFGRFLTPPLEKSMLKDGLLKGKRILITGGGSGLGREMAFKYAELGADLFLCGRRKDVVEKTAREIREAHGVKVRADAVDIRNADQVDSYVQSIWDDGGPLDGLMNNAAGNFISRTEDLSHRGFDAIANTVMHGTFYVTHSVGRRWVAQAQQIRMYGGQPPTRSVVSILVTWVFNGGPFVVPSAMAKSAIANMTKSLAVEWGRWGVRLNAIAPGEFPTQGMNARLSPGQKTTGREEANPMQRVGRMSELQNLSGFLMAEGADWMTGQVITIDGANSLATGGNFYHYRSYGDDDWNRVRETIRAQDVKDKAQRAT
jgi:NAD(P)-dependent dehydrogenase (short-subunit alcohol dehydrogenase family)